MSLTVKLTEIYVFSSCVFPLSRNFLMRGHTQNHEKARLMINDVKQSVLILHWIFLSMSLCAA
jgi:hypothetical protein